MNRYLRSILLTVTGCHLLLFVTTEFGGTGSRKIIRFLCGIVLLLTIFSPLQKSASALQQALQNIKTVSMDDSLQEGDQAYAIAESTYSYIAEKWIAYLTEKYAVPRDEIRIVFHTDINHVLTHAEIALKNCYYSHRIAIEKDLSTQTDLPITVKGW